MHGFLVLWMDAYLYQHCFKGMFAQALHEHLTGHKALLQLIFSRSRFIKPRKTAFRFSKKTQ